MHANHFKSADPPGLRVDPTPFFRFFRCTFLLRILTLANSAFFTNVAKPGGGLPPPLPLPWNAPLKILGRKLVGKIKDGGGKNGKERNLKEKERNEKEKLTQMKRKGMGRRRNGKEKKMKRKDQGDNCKKRTGGQW